MEESKLWGGILPPLSTGVKSIAGDAGIFVGKTYLIVDNWVKYS